MAHKTLVCLRQQHAREMKIKMELLGKSDAEVLRLNLLTTTVPAIAPAGPRSSSNIPAVGTLQPVVQCSLNKNGIQPDQSKASASTATFTAADVRLEANVSRPISKFWCAAAISVVIVVCYSVFMNVLSQRFCFI